MSTLSRNRQPVYAVAVSAQPQEAERLARAIELHDRAVNGDRQAAVEAYELFKAAHAAAPGDPVVQAYCGSATALMGRDTVDQDERFALGLRGLKLLDRAVEHAPNSVTVRTLRGYVALRLPETYFHRTYTAIEDFGHLVELYERDHSTLPEGFYQQLLWDLGQAYQNVERRAEAQATWRKLAAITKSQKFLDLLKSEGVVDLPFDSPATEGGRTEPLNPGPESLLAAEVLEAIRLHDRGALGDPEAARKAEELLSALRPKHPGDPIVEGYFASASSLVGKYSSDSGRMFEGAITAMMTLDHLVAKNPDNVRLRLLRAGHSYRLPQSFFRRSATAIADFAYLLSRADESSSLLAPQVRQELQYKLGACYERLGMIPEACSAWTAFLTTSPDPALQRQVQERLQFLALASSPEPPLPGDPPRLLEEGMGLLRLGAEGNPAAAHRAHQCLTKAYAQAPDDPLILAAYGSSVALVGKYSAKPDEMFTKTIEGLMLLKKAAGQDTQDPRIRMLRGFLCSALPEVFFHLTDRAVKDLKFVVSAYQQGDQRITADVADEARHRLERILSDSAYKARSVETGVK